MEYRLICNTVTGETLVIGSDGYVSLPVTGNAAPPPAWWSVPRHEYNTALWEHPLWAVLARYHGDILVAPSDAPTSPTATAWYPPELERPMMLDERAW